jgi:ABC-2 type transport system permease protein
MWPLRLLVARLRPFKTTTAIRSLIVAIAFSLLLAGDYLLFRRIFRAVGSIEPLNPALGFALLRGLLSMVFLVAGIVLFSSAMTAAIGSFFIDLDLEMLHAAPIRKTRLLVRRWGKTAAQSGTWVVVFLLPLIAAFGRVYQLPVSFYAETAVALVLVLSIPITAGALVILVLVRYFPVGRVHQLIASVGVLVLTLTVVGFRMSRPERFFGAFNTDDIATLVRAIDLPQMSRYPTSWLAEGMLDAASGEPGSAVAVLLRPAAGAAGSLALFIAVAAPLYFRAFVRARESLAPQAFGGSGVTKLLDRLLRRVDPPFRALISKEVRTLTRDVAQWSQLFLMAALMFIYLYNIRMLPLGHDARAGGVAYANLGMAGFVISAICLRFAYPAVSSEGKAFWLIQTSPVSYRRLLWAKVLVYGVPLTLLALILAAFADLLLDADLLIWSLTMLGALLFGITLVSLGVGMGGAAPDFSAENPLQVGLSLGGFGYMAGSLLYVGVVMVLLARPVQRYVLWKLFGAAADQSAIVIALPIVAAVALSAAIVFISLLVARRQLEALSTK